MSHKVRLTVCAGLSSCSVPSALAKIYSNGSAVGSRSINSAILMIFRVQLKGTSIYLSWTGGISRDDALQVSDQDLYSDNIQADEISGDIVDVYPIYNVKYCKSVSVRAISSYCYAIISTSCELAESIFLQRYPLVYCGQSIVLHISSTLSVELKVETIDHSDGSNLTVARLSQDTSVTVLPPVSTEFSDKDGSTNIENSSSSSSNRKHTIDTNGLFYYTSSMYGLRVIPEALYRLSSASDGRNSLRSYTTNHDENACYVGVDYVNAIIGVLSSPNADSTSNCIDKDTLSVHAKSTRFIAVLKYKGAKVVTSLVISSDIPRYHVRVSDSRRRSLNITDYETVSVRLISDYDSIMQQRVYKHQKLVATLIPMSSSNIDNSDSSIEEVQRELIRQKCKNTALLLSHDSIISCDCIHSQSMRSNTTYRLQLVDKAEELSGRMKDVPNYVFFDNDDDDRLTDFLSCMTIQTSGSSSAIDANATAATVDTSIIAPSISLGKNLMGFKDVVADIMYDIKAHLHHDRIACRLRHSVVNRMGGYLVGAAGSGKTSILSTVYDYCKISTSLIAYCHYFDCVSIATKSLKFIVQQLTEQILDSFTRSNNGASFVLMLDNLDSLFTSPGSSSTAPYIALHLNRLFQSLQQSTKRIEIMNQCSYMMDCSSTSDGGDANTCCRLIPSMYVLVSVTSMAALQPLKLGLSKKYEVPILDTYSRLAILATELKDCGISNAHELMDGINRNDIASAVAMTDGYSVRDLKLIARRCVVSIPPAMYAFTRNHCNVMDVVPVLKGVIKAYPRDTDACGSYATIEQRSLGSIWSTIGGMLSAKESIRSTLHLPITFRKLYLDVPISLPNGILLYGPPGCGKTRLATAAGSYYGFDFYPVKGPELLSKYIGASEKAIRDLFHKASTSSRPALIFFDEIDAIASKRGKDNNSGVTDRIVNQLLTCIDGVDTGRKRVFIIAATSRPDMIDSALLRPGRIEKHIHIGMPSVADAKDVLMVSLQSLVSLSNNVCYLSDDVTACVEEIVATDRLKQMTASDIKGIADEAYLTVLRAHRSSSIGANVEQPLSVCISGTHLLQAFSSITPSLSRDDIKYYNSMKICGAASTNANGSNNISVK